MNPLHKKLLLKPGQRVLLLQAPTDVRALLLPLPEDAHADEAPAAGAAYDVVLAFADSVAALAAVWPAARDAYQTGKALWLAYPKLTGKIQSDITRDRGWAPLTADGYAGVTQVALDDTWSALRFRQLAEIPKLTRKFAR